MFKDSASNPIVRKCDVAAKIREVGAKHINSSAKANKNAVAPWFCVSSKKQGCMSSTTPRSRK